MRTEITMPQMGESIAEGTVVKWLKSVGDYVEKDEDLFEISTDKVESVIPAAEAGYLAEITVGPGEKVAVGTVLGYLTSDEADVGGDSSGAAAQGAADVSKATTEAAEEATPGAKPAAREGNEDASAADLRRTRSTPLVRRIAAEHDIDLTSVEGTGLSGRVTKKDILSYIEDYPASTATEQAAAPTTTGGGATFTIEAPEVAIGPRDRVEPLSVMRQNIAEHMVFSRRLSAHCQTVHQCDVTHVETLRRKYKQAYADKGVKLTFTSFLVKAVADALRAYPIVNASLSGNNVVYRGDVNIGVAVALEAGLIVPVVRDADELSVRGLSRAIGDLSSRARNKKLQPEDVQGGTFTVSNNGVFGALYGIPIINQPQVAILGVGAVDRRVVVIDDDDSFAVRSVVHLCLSFDHRLIDGASADGFVNAIKKTLSTFPEAAL